MGVDGLEKHEDCSRRSAETFSIGSFVVPAIFVIIFYSVTIVAHKCGFSEDMSGLVGGAWTLFAMLIACHIMQVDFTCPDRGGILTAIGVGILLQAISIAFIALFSQVDVSDTVTMTIPYLIRLFLVDPVAEELCFRGAMLQGLTRRGSILPFWLANAIQAALFGVIHGNPVQIAYAFVCGLVLGGLRQQNGITSAITAHCVCNLSGVVLGLVIGVLS